MCPLKKTKHTKVDNSIHKNRIEITLANNNSQLNSPKYDSVAIDIRMLGQWRHQIFLNLKHFEEKDRSLVYSISKYDKVQSYVAWNQSDNRRVDLCKKHTSC